MHQKIINQIRRSNLMTSDRKRILIDSVSGLTPAKLEELSRILNNERSTLDKIVQKAGSYIFSASDHQSRSTISRQILKTKKRLRVRQEDIEKIENKEGLENLFNDLV